MKKRHPNERPAPTQLEIFIEHRRFQAGWSDMERAKPAGLSKQKPYEFPTVRCEDLQLDPAFPERGRV